ncbi:hypothetical protein D3OALGA1CA_4101 [Olavius algarvensis associated proteobacterium Delta 3]|nr:hypothetical protein D3OALGB2SA_1015 [Olavius algarvensis associated proteobacterium Delta 3]CAB5145242.1 hypothetical protein D3OALGA1CA_4101 [Olavius algarvensis associated proteobacterium Delta 3]
MIPSTSYSVEGIGLRHIRGRYRYGNRDRHRPIIFQIDTDSVEIAVFNLAHYLPIGTKFRHSV